MNQNPPTALDLDEIASRAAHLYEYVNVDVEGAQPDFDKLTGTDVGVLLAEVRRLRAETLEAEAEIAKLRDLLGKENKRANAAIDREETAEQAALEAQQERDKLIRWHREDETPLQEMRGTIERLRATPAPAVSGGEQ